MSQTPPDNNDAIIDLQMRIAYQDTMIDDLSSEVAALRAEIDVQQKQIHYLVANIKQIREGGGEIYDGNETPPHY